MIELLLFIVMLPLLTLILLINTCKGECYYCGHRFGDKPVWRLSGKKWCGCNEDTIHKDKQ